MPITRGAIKKLRQDKKRQKQNLTVKKAVISAVKKLKLNPNLKNLSEAYSLLDSTRKKKIFHKNKVARLKSNLSKLLTRKKETKPVENKKTPSKISKDKKKK